MADTVPPGRRIDRAALERIIQRAAELQAGERDIGDGLTEDEVLQLGADVGISSAHLQLALFEEQTRAVVGTERGMAAWLAGPRRVAAERTLTGSADTLEEVLNYWMAEGELLTVKRRYPDSTAWEARRGALVTLRRSIGAGGRRYLLARARDVVTRVARAGAHRAHVRIVADLGNTRSQHLAGAVGLAITGSGLFAIGATIGVALSVALIPVPLGLLTGFALARARRSELDRMQTALEQILDRLEHDDIRVPSKVPPANPIARIAEEIRRQLAD